MDTKKTPLAVALFAEALSIFCAIAVALFPNQFMKVVAGWTHGIDYTAIWNPSLSFGNVLLGLVSLFIFVYLATWVFVLIYRSLVK